jgi:NAD(P)-dependent dehydrogenase (short-subunit alcohol dehydrogenase family)
LFASVAAMALFAAPQFVFAALSPNAPTVLITGASRGIGLGLAQYYAEHGWNVIATARHSADDGETAKLREFAAKHPQLVYEQIDVTDSVTIRSVAAKYKNQPIDLLINNAAKLEATFAKDVENFSKTYELVDFDAARGDFDVNTLGPMRMAQAFMASIEKSKQKKIVSFTSSPALFTPMKMAPPKGGGAGAGGPPPGMSSSMNYAASKAALDKYMQILAGQVKAKGVIVSLLIPGGVDSKEDTKKFMPMDQAAPRLMEIMDKLTIAQSGVVVNFPTGEVVPF